MNGKDSTLEHGYKYDAKMGVSSCKCGYEAGLRITLGEHIKLEEYKATLNAWLDQRIAFAQWEQTNDDDAQDAQGERYWMGVRTAYLGCKTKLAEIEKD